MGANVADAMTLEDLVVGSILARLDHDQPVLVVFEVALDQRQGAAADRTEADHHDRAGNFGMDRVVGIRHVILPKNRLL
ncbi:hypothetical protein D3C86_1865680 [compost metagenome]